MLFNVHGYPVPIIKSIEIIRQFQALDILAIVNDTYAILIEDKTYTKNHSDQLNRYREEVRIAYPDLVQLPIYYKIADQSHYHSVQDAGYFPFTRERILEVLERGRENGVSHPIFIDYLVHLEKLDSSINAYRTKPVVDWDGFAWQRFYMGLQKHFNGNWRILRFLVAATE
ncbi:PD-(D/E)XK nuclease family protein [Neobacillus sp. LXY-1]|uniref:PD-(D/E)XK nuclease family protein n=1 Tax=Neobacillus sp. LXY-1 TaxID=3379133 RepID=UPI003EE17889